MKIFTKTFLYTLTLLVLIAILANGLIYSLMPKAYAKQKLQDLTERTDMFVEQLEAARREDIVNLMGGFAAATQANIIIQIGGEHYSLFMWSDDAESDGTVSAYVTITKEAGLNTDGESADITISESKNPQTKIKITNAMDGYKETNTTSFQTIRLQRGFVMEGESGTLTVTGTLAPVSEAVSVIVSLLPISIFMCIITAIIFSLLYARTMTRPIKTISDETRHMTLLEPDAKCKVKSKDEFGELAINVNNLYESLLRTINSLEEELKKVSAAERAKADFLRAASHELKTPVTAVSVIMDNMIIGVGKYKNSTEWLPKCKKLVDDLSDKIRDILDASRLESTAEPAVTDSIEAICSEVLEPYIIIARAKGLSFYTDWSASFTVTVPPKLLGKAISNIISNAVRYTAQGGKVSIYCKEHKLIVENECIPIAENQIPHLYEPFYRPDTSRSRETGGNGLGMYIVETILRFLELDYCFEPMTAPDGMRFTISF